jgi:predicted cupin superfamily sugar epimerase
MMGADIHPDARNLIEILGLSPHPEGGFYRETFRSTLSLRGLPWLEAGGERSASTAIYFLLPAGSFSAFHHVMADEVWHHYDGDPIELHTLRHEEGHHSVRLGRDLRAGERPQHVVPAGVYQAAAPVGDRYALCGCTVAPGFDFADFAMPSRSALLAEFGASRALIERFTRRGTDTT